MTWGGSGPFLFDGASVEVGFLPVSEVAAASGGNLTVSIAANEDDGIEAAGLGYINSGVTNGVGDTAGITGSCNLRFTGITIPQGATITVATLTAGNQFAEVNGQAPTALWYGWLTDDSPQMDGVTDLPSTVPKTTAFETFISTGSSTPYNQDHDVTSIVQEIINQGGWVSGNALTLLAIDNGSGTAHNDSFTSFDTGSGSVPSLYIEWTSGAPTNIEGTLSATLGALTPSATGTVTIAGTHNQSLGTLTSTATGTLAIAGTLSQTLGALTGTATGALAISGSLNATLGELTASGAAGLEVDGALNVTLGDLTAAATGALQIQGVLTATLGELTLSSEGQSTPAPIEGVLDATLGELTASGAGDVSSQVQENYSGRYPGIRLIPKKKVDPNKGRFFGPDPIPEEEPEIPAPVVQGIEIPRIDLLPQIELPKLPDNKVALGSGITFDVTPVEEFEDVFGDFEMLALCAF